MPRESAAAKGRRYLLEGRLVVTHVSPVRARALVRGDGHIWRVEVDGPTWWCSCPAVRRCSHQIALGLVVAINLPEPPTAQGGHPNGPD